MRAFFFLVIAYDTTLFLAVLTRFAKPERMDGLDALGSFALAVGLGMGAIAAAFAFEVAR